MSNLFDIPPAWTFLHILAVWVVSSVWTFGNPEIQLVGWIVIIFAVAIMVWTVIVMSRAKTPIMPGEVPEVLVTKGPFSYSRNPIYFADCLVVFGAALAFGQPLAGVLAFLLGWVLQKRYILGEEERLSAKFGPAWDDYVEEVRRWL